MPKTAVAGLAAAAVALLPVGAVPLAAGAPAPPEPPAPIEAMVLDSLESDGTADIWVDLEAQADLTASRTASGWEERGQAVYDALTATANASQRELRAQLDAEGADYQPFFISNVIHLEDADRSTVTSLASRPEVAQITASDTLAPPPEPTSPAAAPQALSWGVRDIGADRAWREAGTRGEGVVVGLIDTGVQWDHPALREQYRGTRGGRVNHDYAWFDATGGGAPAPVDNNSHGTHVAGTLVGDDGQGNQIGVAPGAEWIAANGCTALCTDAQLLASAQWMLAPTRVDGSDPDPARRPDIVNSSWGSVRPANRPWFDDSIRAWHAAGIFDVFSNGNHGTRGCRSSGAPGSTSLAYSVGNYQRDHGIADTSSRGSGAGGNLKPNVAAPGADIVSAAPGGGYATKSGTSMAAPHVAGAVALLWSARPELVGDISRTRAIMDRSATDTTDLTCGGTGEDNNVFGEGRVDVPALLAQTERWSVERWSGDGRYATAAQIAARYPAGVRTVYLVAGGGGDTSYADAVAVASAAAGDVVGAGSSAPVLLINSQRQVIPDATRQALAAIDPQRVVLLGGTRSIAPTVQRQLARDYAVTRIDGRAGFPGDRYATAADLAHRFPSTADRVYVASGANLADALAGGALAGRDDAPLLLVRQDRVPAATQEAIDRFPDAEVVVLGGTSSVSEAVRRAVGARPGDRVAGPDRYATAWLIADRFGSAREAFVAGGQDAALIDAVTGSALAGSRGEPMLITPGTASTAPGALLEQAVRMGAERLVVLGGPASVSADVLRDLAG